MGRLTVATVLSLGHYWFLYIYIYVFVDVKKYYNEREKPTLSKIM